MRFSTPAIGYVAASMAIGEHSCGDRSVLGPGWSWNTEEHFTPCFTECLRQRSPWRALAICGVPIAPPTDSWPTIQEISFTDILINSLENDTPYWDVEMLVTVRIDCPYCHTTYDYGQYLSSFPYQPAFDGLYCHSCHRPVWPFRSPLAQQHQPSALETLPDNLIYMKGF